MEDKIIVSFIIEILGRPKEHLEESLKNVVKKLNDEKGVRIIESKIHEPRLLEQKPEQGINEVKDKVEKAGMTTENEIYTMFAEVEAELDDLNSLLVVSFNYMPSNIEISHPENFILKNVDIGSILTNTILRLHRYDELVKKISVDKAILEDKVKELTDKKD
tara:strand:- start:530 stop:1015 length:486 start_codon:yes stop_codon:yes gene_type:complete